MKLDGRSTAFQYHSSYWTDDRLLNDDPALLDDVTEAKLQPFNDLPGRTIRLLFTTPDNRTGQPVDVPVGGFSSLRSLFNGSYLPTDVPANVSGWYGAFAGNVTHQLYCNKQGVNVDTPASSLWAGGGGANLSGKCAWEFLATRVSLPWP